MEDETKYPTIEFELSERDMARLHAEASYLGITFEQLINRIIKTAIKKLPKNIEPEVQL